MQNCNKNYLLEDLKNTARAPRPIAYLLGPGSPFLVASVDWPSSWPVRYLMASSCLNTQNLVQVQLIRTVASLARTDPSVYVIFLTWAGHQLIHTPVVCGDS